MSEFYTKNNNKANNNTMCSLEAVRIVHIVEALLMQKLRVNQFVVFFFFVGFCVFIVTCLNKSNEYKQSETV